MCSKRSARERLDLQSCSSIWLGVTKAMSKLALELQPASMQSKISNKRVLQAKCSGVPGFAIVLEHLLWGGQNKTEARFGLAARLLALQKQHKDGSKRSARERLDLLSSSSTAFVAT